MKVWNPTVSVLIPTYNRAYSLERAIRSVFNQTYQNFEIIIVDDGSTDNTEELVRSYNDERIKYLKNKINKGASAARNIGISNASGDLLSFLDSDDEWLPSKLDSEIKIFNKNSNCIAVSTGYIFIDERTQNAIKKTVFEERIVTQDVALRGDCLTTNDFTAKKEAIISIGGFDENLPARQDWDIWIRMSSIGLCIQVPLYTVKKHLFHGDQISTSYEKKINGTLLLFEKHRDLFSSEAEACYRILKMIGLFYLFNNDNSNAKFYFKESLKLTKVRKKRVKLIIALLLLKNFDNFGAQFIKSYYKFKDPYNYFLWGN